MGPGWFGDGVVLAELRHVGVRGSSAALPGLAAAVLGGLGAELRGVAVTVGPGSFTGVRAGLALAQGIGLALGVRVRGVSVGGAIRAESGAVQGGRTIWVAVGNRRGRVFLDREGVRGGIVTVGLDALPSPVGPVAVAGDAAIAVASRLAARGFDVQLLAGRGCRGLGDRAGCGA